MSERFFLQKLADEGVEVEIGGSEAHHLLRVMRVSSGAPLRLFDGQGQEACAVVTAISKETVRARITFVARVDRELAVNLVLGVALPRGDRARFLVEKLTELGVARLVPLVTGRSTVTPGSSAISKLSRYVVEASKQCGRNQLMQVQEPTRIEDFLVQRSMFESCIVLQPESQSPLTVEDVRGAASVGVCVGPEGGWTSAEMEMLTGGGWEARHLGPRILRTETAAVALAAVCSSLVQAARR